jgi:hypothetical protein
VWTRSARSPRPAVATLTLVARVDATGALVNNAAVTAQDQADPDPLNNSDAASINASAAADLRVTKAVSDLGAGAAARDQQTSHGSRMQPGPSACHERRHRHALPAGVTFVISATASQGTYDSASGLLTVGAVPATDRRCRSRFASRRPAR